MNNYDFKSLNDKEFEALACDLLGGHLGQRFERFKSGRDGGVDGRFFLSENREVVLQCKHWANTPVTQLVTRLSKFERPKLAKLRPEEYFIAVTNNLSRRDKTKIKIALSPYIKSESFIYGSEDLNDLLSKAGDIEKRHYKLWLHSASVLSVIMSHAILGRSRHTVEEIKADTARYAMTENHHRALAQLENLGVLIITGEPGIGKTTLANHLCLHYVAQGYQLVVISDDINEAEDILDNESKQIFYFDDFLGRNYLDALKGHEGQKITKFIRRISRSKNKKFILTSRSTILNQGKLLIDVYSHENLQRNEYEMKISLLSDMDKAHILYNQIWHSRLGIDYVDEIYKDGRYRQIVGHKNYNPRLINYITDANRIDSVSPNLYWKFVGKSLANPAEIWDNPCTAQQDDFGRAIILLVVLNRQPMAQELLAEAYHEFISLPRSQNMKGRSDFINNIRTLTGSFLNRIVDNASIKIDLFNPSIGDYILERYRADPLTLEVGFVCLNNTNALITLKSLTQNNIIESKNSQAIAVAMLESAVSGGFAKVKTSFLAELVQYVAVSATVKPRLDNSLREAIRFVLERIEQTDSTEDAFLIIKLGVEKNWVTNAEALKFVDDLAHFLVADKEIENCWSLMKSLETDDNYQSVFNKVIAEISNNVSKNISRFIDVSTAFADCNRFDNECAVKNLIEKLGDKLNGLGLRKTDFDLNYLLRNFNVEKNMKDFFRGEKILYVPPSSAASTISSEAKINDLFERS